MINAMAMRQAVMANTPHTATASGSMASFSTDMVGKLRHLVVGIEPVQDLHGYDNPWPAGGGKNKFDQDTVFGNTRAEHQSDGSWYFSSNALVLPDTPIWQNTFGYTGQVTISLIRKTLNASGSGGARFKYKYSDDSTSTVLVPNSTTFVSVTATSNADKTVSAILWDFGTAINSTWLKDMQVELSASVSSYAPYSNICPVTGWTGLTLNHSGADTSSPDTLNISWESEAGTVYGGTLDVVTGVLTVDRATVTFDGSNMTNMSMESTKYADQKRLFIGRQRFVPASASPSASSAVGNIRSNQYKTASADTTYLTREICIASRSNGAYIYDNNLQSVEAFSTAWQATPLQIVYELAVHQTYQLPQTMVKSLIGTNNVWADTGDVESLTYWTH